MNQTKITQIKKEYYTDFILNKILDINYCYKINGNNKFREFAILNNKTNKNIEYKKIAFRGITFSNINFLKKTLFNEFYPERNFLNNDSSMYCSVAILNKIPFFPFTNRNYFTKPFFEKEYYKYIFDFDIFLDLDYDKKIGTFEEFLKEVDFLINLLDKNFNLNFRFTFSGSRGFKFLIINNQQYKYNEIINICSNIKREFNLKFLDLAGHIIPSKLMKADYSLAFKNNKCKIVLPINFFEYEDIINYITKKKDFSFFDYENDNNKFLIQKEYINKQFKYFSNIEHKKENLKRFVETFNLLRN